MRRVIKYGGTSLATPAHFDRAARAISSLVDLGEQIAVVVSAMEDQTDQLIAELREASRGHADYRTQVEFLCLGEEKSVLMMAAALQAQKVTAKSFLPRLSQTWPIVVDSDDVSLVAPVKTNEERDFTVRTQKTANRFSRNVLPLLRLGQVPVIAGFTALSSRDELITFGRGGSDVTAVIVASFIDADEVVLVTDVAGVMSADPRLAENPRLLENISLEDAHALASAGIQVIHPRSLKFKPANLRLRVVDFNAQEELTRSGTTIEGASQPMLFRNESQLAVVSVIGAGWGNRPGLMARLMGPLADEGIPVCATSACSHSVSFYLDEKLAERAHHALHEMVLAEPETFTGISLRGGIGELRVRLGEVADTREVLADIAQFLAHRRITVVEMMTSLADISIYVPWESMEEAHEGLSKLLRTRY